MGRSRFMPDLLRLVPLVDHHPEICRLRRGDRLTLLNNTPAIIHFTVATKCPADQITTINLFGFLSSRHQQFFFLLLFSYFSANVTSVSRECRVPPTSERV